MSVKGLNVSTSRRSEIVYLFLAKKVSNSNKATISTIKSDQTFLYVAVPYTTASTKNKQMMQNRYTSR